MKKIVVTALIICLLVVSGYRKPESYTIDAHMNATNHNNKGLMYMQEAWWYPAIQEFKMAISLNPDTQASAVFYNNLGECYMKIGYADMAQDCFERAVKLYSLNLKFFQNLADCYDALDIVSTKINQTYENDNPFNYIMRGLLLEKQGDLQDAITILDEFVAKEPDLIITPAVKGYIQKLVKKVY